MLHYAAILTTLVMEPSSSQVERAVSDIEQGVDAIKKQLDSDPQALQRVIENQLISTRYIVRADKVRIRLYWGEPSRQDRSAGSLFMGDVVKVLEWGQMQAVTVSGETKQVEWALIESDGVQGWVPLNTHDACGEHRLLGPVAPSPNDYLRRARREQGKCAERYMQRYEYAMSHGFESEEPISGAIDDALFACGASTLVDYAVGKVCGDGWLGDLGGYVAGATAGELTGAALTGDTVTGDKVMRTFVIDVLTDALLPDPLELAAQYLACVYISTQL